ncbi:MAG: aldehyde dehydrogenase family protein [Planctomycetes bacterium]|nr:aldehyde dehydrogenase family protein [Planctomycetota bacterium]
MISFPLRIADQRIRTPQVDVVRNPYDGEPVGEVCLAGAEHMDRAIALAAETFPAFRRMPTHARAAILERAAEALEASEDELTELMAREGGKPVRFGRGEVQRAALTFRLAAGEARRFGGEVMPVDIEARAEGRTCISTRVPRGPVAAIAPFNFPLNLIVHKLAPAIAIGAPVVLKPPPQCPLTGLTLGEILLEAGLPAEALTILPCAPEIAQRMVEDERMKVLSFTGSDAVGWKLKRVAGKKQVLLELGGNAPCVVDASANVDAALPSIVAGAFAHAGQVCIKVQRVLVHDTLYETFLERFVTATRQVRCGNPLDQATVVGPLIDHQHVERIRTWVAQAVAGGAKLHCGGEIEAHVVQPVVLTRVTEDMRVSCDEVFGPVVTIEPFTEFGAALETCNRTRYGLQAGVFTNDLNHALLAHRELDYGGVMINDVPTFRVDNFPYGGTKDSGFGREGVRFAMEEMSEPRVLVLRGL